MTTSNVDERTVRSFGAQWSAYDQNRLSTDERTPRRFGEYFGIFPWDSLPKEAVGADVGCGSGRWALLVAPRVGTLHCVDASEQALTAARRNLVGQPNCHFHQASVDAIPIPPCSLDFCYSLGVLHCVPDTMAGIEACVTLLKPGAPFLLYHMYALDDRPWWFRSIWKSMDIVRRGISRLPVWPRRVLTELIALTVYWPVARFAALVERLGCNPAVLPLSWYRDKSFYTMRTNAHDRFATPLEHRFSRPQIEVMMRKAGLDDICFSDRPPFWCAVGRRQMMRSSSSAHIPAA
jgi:SAM-dependent methyltransferase